MADLLNASELSQVVTEKLEELNKEEVVSEENTAPVEGKSDKQVEEKDSSINKEESKNVEETIDVDKETVTPQEEGNEENNQEEDSKERSDEELKQFATENNIPKSISLNVVKDWDKIPDEARKAMLKLANDADRFANTVKENQGRRNGA